MGIKLKNVFSIIVVCLMFFIVIPMADADEDSLAVFLFLEDLETYNFNDTIHITVHVLDKGEYSDPVPPNAVSVKVNNSLDIPLNKVSTGIYTGSYKLSISQAIYTFGDWHFYFKANASKSPFNWDASERSIIIPGEEPTTSDFSVVLDVKDAEDRNPRPGDTIELVVKVKQDNVYVDPDELSLTSHGDELSSTRTGTGIYEASFKVDSSIKETEVISIGAQATYNGAIDVSYLDLSINFLNVWLHNATVGNTSASFEIWVADLKGKAVAGAFIDLVYPVGDKDGTTDRNGRGVFSMSYNEPVDGIVSISGKVTAPTEETQSFSQSFYVGETYSEPQPTAGKFEVFPISGDRSVEPGEVIKRGYVAYNDTVLWAGKTIYYYAIFRNSSFSKEGYILDNGGITTENNGRFNLSITAPDNEGILRIYFESAVEPSTSSNDNLRYKESDDPYIAISEPTTELPTEPGMVVSAGELLIGGEVDVTVTMSGTSGHICRASWYVKDESWTWLSGSFFSYLKSGDGTFTGSVYIPEFLPLNKVYPIVVTLIDPITGETYYNYTLKTPAGVAPADKEEDEGLDMLTIIPIIILIIILVVLFVVASKGGKGAETKKAPPEDKEQVEELEKEEMAEEGEEGLEELEEKLR